MALAGLASADTQFLDLSKDTTSGTLKYDAATGNITTSTAADFYQVSNGKAETNVIITFNLTEAAKVTTNTKIIELDYNGDRNVSLLATKDGLVGGWNGGAYGDNTVSWETLLSDSTVFTDYNGEKHITLMVSQWNNQNITFLVNTGKSQIITTSGLGSSSISSMEALYVNSNFVDAVNVTPAWKTDNATRQSATAAFNTTVKNKIVPEPTTATLSLLALAGLAARRRRR